MGQFERFRIAHGEADRRGARARFREHEYEMPSFSKKPLRLRG